MDRDDLLSLLQALNDGQLAVKPDGTLMDLDKCDDYSISAVESAAAELTADLAKLIAWAKLAPEYQPTPVTTRDDAGKLCDADGLPL